MDNPELVTEPTKPATKRKPPARKASRPAPVAAKPSIMEGMTVSDCPIACTAKQCVISGRGICAHPHKGGLQSALQTPDSLRRFNEAKRVLGKQRLDLVR